MRGNVLVIDDDPHVFEDLKASLPAHNLFYMQDLTGINDTFNRKQIDLAIVDLNLRSKRKDDHFSGLDYLRKIRERFPSVAIMVLSAYRDIDRITTAIHNGADVYEWKGALDMDTPEFREKINALVKGKKRADQQRARLKAEIWGQSPVMQKVREQVETYAKSRESFFLVGEKGLPKENIVNYLHYRAAFYADTRPPIYEDMRGWDPLELTKVLQTKPASRQKNFLKEAYNNILFLDHFDALSHDTQEAFLEIAQSRRYLRSREPLHIQFVLGLLEEPEVSAAGGSLSPAALHTLPVVYVSPLRERKMDTGLLIHKWMETYGYDPALISEPILDRFRAYAYPGNERELYDLLEVMMQAHRERYARRDAYMTEAVHWQEVPGALTHPELSPCDLKQATARFELARIEEALNRCGGRKEEAARLLGIKNADLLKKTYVQKYADKYPLIIQDFPLIVKLYNLYD